MTTNEETTTSQSAENDAEYPTGMLASPTRTQV